MASIEASERLYHQLGLHRFPTEGELDALSEERRHRFDTARTPRPERPTSESLVEAVRSGESQASVAERFGVSQSSVSRAMRKSHAESV
jgi:DNA-binding transcriptional LysR family regulator